MRDTLPKKPKMNEVGIINLDDFHGNGTHWVAYGKTKSVCEYFDSFGDLKPPQEFIKYMRDSPITYNYSKLQKFNSVRCGHLCLEFIMNFCKRNFVIKH